MSTKNALWRRVKGLSAAEFRARFVSEVPCCAGQGLGLSFLRARRYAELKGRAVYQCKRCKHQVGLTILDQAVADDVIPDDLPPNPEQRRNIDGRAGLPLVPDAKVRCLFGARSGDERRRPRRKEPMAYQHGWLSGTVPVGDVGGGIAAATGRVRERDRMIDS